MANENDEKNDNHTRKEYCIHCGNSCDLFICDSCKFKSEHNNIWSHNYNQLKKDSYRCVVCYQDTDDYHRIDENTIICRKCQTESCQLKSTLHVEGLEVTPETKEFKCKEEDDDDNETPQRCKMCGNPSDEQYCNNCLIIQDNNRVLNIPLDDIDFSLPTQESKVQYAERKQQWLDNGFEEKQASRGVCISCDFKRPVNEFLLCSHCFKYQQKNPGSRTQDWFQIPSTRRLETDTDNQSNSQSGDLKETIGNYFQQALQRNRMLYGKRCHTCGEKVIGFTQLPSHQIICRDCNLDTHWSKAFHDKKCNIEEIHPCGVCGKDALSTTFEAFVSETDRWLCQQCHDILYISSSCEEDEEDHVVN